SLHFLLLMVRIGPKKYDTIEPSVGSFKVRDWFDMSLFEGLNILYANPGRLESCQDPGLSFMGDMWGLKPTPHAPILSIEKRELMLDSVPLEETPENLWRAQVAVLK